jgi:hypothetical protein
MLSADVAATPEPDNQSEHPNVQGSLFVGMKSEPLATSLKRLERVKRADSNFRSSFPRNISGLEE